MSIPEFTPDVQIAFAIRLEEIEQRQLQQALSDTVSKLAIRVLDADYGTLLPNDRLARLAAVGLRAETFFPCLHLLEANPRLLGYYRLLYGLSQKSFYGRLNRFKSMEERGVIAGGVRAELNELCTALCETGWLLLANLQSVSLERIRDLQLLTLGPQLRGGRLNVIGQAAATTVLRRIRAAVQDSSVVEERPDRIVVKNAAGRRVTVAFSSDPDIAISEELSSSVTNRLAIEIKGGTDVSNIHNRLGEAEKSHRKAKDKGFTEFWTILNAAVGLETAAQESPTTNLFFELSRIIDPDDVEWTRFRDELTARLGVPASPVGSHVT